MGKTIERLRELSWHDLLIVAVPLLALIAVGFWLASRFIQPAPPGELVLSTGGEGGAYQRFAASYADVLARHDIKLVEQPSAGSLENLQRLRNGEMALDAGFFQGGTGSPTEDDGLRSLGSFFLEPLWIFHREGLSPPGGLRRIAQLKGQRIAIGGAGSGNRHLALELLQANGIDGLNTKLVDRGGLDLVTAFARGEIDAAFVVGPTQSATVWSLLFAEGVRLMNLVDAEAYTHRFPHLSTVTLHRGVVDFGEDMPARDVTLLAANATLLVREETHPALVGILLQAATEVHGRPGIFQKPGEFPRGGAVDFPLAPEAERYYKSGKPFLQRYLPFWAATLVDRMVVLLIPVFALLIPLLKFAQPLYTWRVRSRIYRRYGELKFLEAEVEAEPGKQTREEWMARLDVIENDVNHVPTPLAFADMLYTLRSHIDLVRAAILRRTG